MIKILGLGIRYNSNTARESNKTHQACSVQALEVFDHIHIVSLDNKLDISHHSVILTQTAEILSIGWRKIISSKRMEYTPLFTLQLPSVNLEDVTSTVPSFKMTKRDPLQIRYRSSSRHHSHGIVISLAIDNQRGRNAAFIAAALYVVHTRARMISFGLRKLNMIATSSMPTSSAAAVSLARLICSFFCVGALVEEDRLS